MNNPIIVALDGMTSADALATAEALRGKVWGVKVNDLFFAHGIAIVRMLKEHQRVMLDWKGHDIPNTVTNTATKFTTPPVVRDADDQPVTMADAMVAPGSTGQQPDIVTVHASGGVPMMQAAVRTLAPASSVAAVTVLTSLDTAACQAIYGAGPAAVVAHFAQMAVEAGVAYLVCSAQELDILSSVALPKITPGIRPAWFQDRGDQQRTTTPAEAIARGARFLVMGRPILKAACGPVEAAERTLAEIAKGV